MIHPQTQLRFIDDQIGYGVFATSFIAAGTLVYVQDALDIVLPPHSPLLQDKNHRPLIDKYAVLEPPHGRRVLCWDIAKYVNHCCHCNVISTGYGFEIALRDIQPDEEITDEYALFNLNWDLTLICRHEDCRGQLRLQDLDHACAQWDAQIQAALTRVSDVPQPLWPYLDAEIRQALSHFLQTGKGYRSVQQLLLRRSP